MENSETASTSPSRRPPRPTFTFFHALWLAGALGTGYFAYFVPNKAEPILRLVSALIGLIGGFIVFGVAVLFLVTAAVIPRLTPGSYWAYEVDCYMLHVIGKEWGGDQPPPN
jgi:hypothetical protein